MQAELHGKLSMTSLSPKDRLEDTLTDGVFSALRYLPRSVLLAWLREAVPGALAAHLTDAAAEEAEFEFWPKLSGGAEADVMIVVNGLAVIVEAKYESGFGSWGDTHQLAVEWQQGRESAREAGWSGPVVIAVTKDLREPDLQSARRHLDPHALEEAGLSAEQAIRWQSWHSIAEAIRTADSSTWQAGAKAVAGDALELMARRKVLVMFDGFSAQDWILLQDAAERARTRVYPAVADYCRDLIARADEYGLEWAASRQSAQFWGSSSFDSTDAWHRDYVLMPLWSPSLGVRPQLNELPWLYVGFDFREGIVRAGVWVRFRGDSGAERAAGIGSWLRRLGHEWRASSGYWGHDRDALPAGDADAAWVSSAMSRGRDVRIERTWPPQDVVSATAALEALQFLTSSMKDDGSLVAALVDDGNLVAAGMSS
jgi:hypothetical protein